jgi:hypothetical protein
MALPFAFTVNTTPTGEQLDADLAALGALTPIPCVVAGSNNISLTPEANTPVPAYAPYSQFSGVAAGTNNTQVTAQVGSLAALAVYKDTIVGPVQLSGGEIVQNTKLLLMYDPTLNAGSGGFHLISPASANVRTHNTVASIALAALLPQTGTVAIVPLAGTSIGDVIDIGFPASVSVGLAYVGYVPNAGTVNLNIFNMTSGTVTPNAGNYTVAARGYAP